MVLEKLNQIFGQAGVRLIAKLLLVVIGLSLVTFRPEFMTEILQNRLFNLSFLPEAINGANVLGFSAFVLAVMIHKNHL
jgi:hypothetical protein|tara:strand:- start:702 stop:938 length:237 start_codon:yes stop_codon:yes gene_type:complete